MPRDEVILASELIHSRPGVPGTRQQFESRLVDLGIEYIDICYIGGFGEHGEDLDAVAEAMLRFQEEGKIRFLGLRGFESSTVCSEDSDLADFWQRLLEVTSWFQPAVLRIPWTMVGAARIDPARNVLTSAESRNRGVVVSGFPFNSLHFDEEPDSVAGQCLQPLRERFGSRIEDLVQVLIQFFLTRSATACVVASFDDSAQVERGLGTADYRLASEEVEIVNTVWPGIVKAIGASRGTTSHCRSPRL
jgi:aryl-alcohol dehydrogenase-like predicted oxidoreductase